MAMLTTRSVPKPLPTPPLAYIKERDAGDIEEHLTEDLRRFTGGAGLQRDLRQHGEAEVDVRHGAKQGRVVGA
jgi:hypothetical protein